MTSPTPRTSRCSEPLAGEMGTPSSTRQPVAAAVGLCLIAIAVSLVLRVVYLSQPWRIDASVPAAFLTAEGLVGLMGRHIVRGARPVFYYGQFYLGAFEAYLAALAFKVFGASMTTLRVVPTVSAVMWVPLTGAVAWQLYGRRAGLLAATIIALPSPFVFEWGFIAWGGHAHVTLMLLALNLLVLVLQRATPLRLATLGFVSGFAVWVKFFPESRYASLFVSKRVVGNIDAEKPELLHQTGIAYTNLRPSGTALINHQRVDVVTEGGMIERGTAIKVIALEGMRVVVRTLDSAEPRL